MQLYFDESKMPDEKTVAYMEKAAILCAEGEGLNPDEVSISVSFVGKDKIKKLNAEYRGVDSVTDVLSFPQFDDLADASMYEEIELGDVVICLAKCREQAKEFGHSEDREIIYLFVHSVLHLLGYDHEDEVDKAKMRVREEAVMGELDLLREE